MFPDIFFCTCITRTKNILYNSSQYHFLGTFASNNSELQSQVIQVLCVAPLNVDPFRVLILTLISKLFFQKCFCFFFFSSRTLKSIICFIADSN